MKRKSAYSFSSIIIALCIATAFFIGRIVDANNADASDSVKTEKKAKKGTVKSSSKSSDNTATSSKQSKKDSSQDDLLGVQIPAIAGYYRAFTVHHKGYTLSYNVEHNCPNWSAWALTKEETDGPVQRSSKFHADPLIPKENCVDYFDYKDSGYDRGHMCPAGDMKWDEEAMHDCFYMSNMCPQDHALNTGSWKVLEEACRTWARTEGIIYICCGPVFKGKKHERIGIQHAIDVPEGFFKVVLSTRKGHEKAIAFYYDNNDVKQPMSKAAMSVDDMEKKLNMDFFYTLEPNLQDKVESTYNLKDWK